MKLRYSLLVLFMMFCNRTQAMNLYLPMVSVSLPVEDMREMHRFHVVMQNRDYSCGAAAVATLMRYHYGQSIDEADVIDGMITPATKDIIAKKGFSMLDMKRFLESRGLQADGFKLSLESLEQDTRVPAIALMTEREYHHFVVIKGVRKGRVLIGDPARGLRSTPIEDFKARWNGTVLLVRNKAGEGRTHFNRDDEWRRQSARYTSVDPLDNARTGFLIPLKSHPL